MARMAIDLDRGVTMRQIVKFDDKNPMKFLPDLAYGGMAVYMYKDTPGVYFNVHGKEVNEHLAEKAGFPIAKLAKQRLKKEKLAQFAKKLEAELAAETDEEVVLAEKDGWKVVALPADRANVIDIESGQPVNEMPMYKNDALRLLGDLTGEEEKA